MLQWKEGFSPYVFEEIAKTMLEANSSYLQLNWLYRHSPA